MQSKIQDGATFNDREDLGNDLRVPRKPPEVTQTSKKDMFVLKETCLCLYFVFLIFHGAFCRAGR